MKIELKQLSPRQREDLPASAFAIPEKRMYPIHDIAHARNALARAAQFGTEEEKAIVKKRVYAKYPELNPRNKFQGLVDKKKQEKNGIK